MSQLALDVEPERENPNAWMFHPDGSSRSLLWPGDGIRIEHQTIGPVTREHASVCPACKPPPLCRWGCCRPVDAARRRAIAAHERRARRVSSAG